VRPRIRTATLTGYAGLARSLGLDPAELMAGVGLDIADLDAPERWIPAAPAARLLDLSARRSNCETFGLRVAQLRRLGTLGPISVVLRDEPDLRSALDLLIRYEHAYTEPLHLRLSETDGLATLEMWLEFGEPAPHGQALDLVMGALLGIVRGLVRSDWEPLLASFSRSAPSDPGLYHDMFGPGVGFDREFTGVVFPVRDLDAPVVTSDSSLRPFTRQFLDLLVGPPPATTSSQVAEVVELMLPLGRCSLSHVSQYLGIRPRALQRSLAEEDESFSSVVHTTRGRQAERYLPNERYSLTDVSRLLGFEAPSAFSRWFHQWFGTSPTEWRRAARAGSPTGTTARSAGEEVSLGPDGDV
jgi:AraC-like DNA-binding protein